MSSTVTVPLVASPAVLRERLRARPAWREWGEARIDEMLEFNDWLRGAAPSLSVELFDTTEVGLRDVVDHVEKWVRERLV